MKYKININLEFPNDITSEDLYGSISIEEWLEFIQPVIYDEINRLNPLDNNNEIITSIDHDRIF